MTREQRSDLQILENFILGFLIAKRLTQNLSLLQNSIENLVESIVTVVDSKMCISGHL